MDQSQCKLSNFIFNFNQMTVIGVTHPANKSYIAEEVDKISQQLINNKKDRHKKNIFYKFKDASLYPKTVQSNMTNSF